MTRETIVLVHGLWMNGLDMSLLAKRLQSYGYRAVGFRYRTIRSTPRRNAAQLDEFVATLEDPIIHFVGHSLGGIILRHLFFDHPARKPGRAVTLGTPHRPSHTAYRLSGYAAGRVLLGQSVQDGLLGNVPPWSGSHDLGSIAGTRSLGLGRIFNGLALPNDGTVSVEETRIPNLQGHTTVHTSHFGLLLSRQVPRLCHNFIRSGTFGSV